MNSPQNGIFVSLSENHNFSEYKLGRAPKDKEIVAALRAISKLADAVGPDLVMGFGANLWKRLSPINMPKFLRAFSAIKGRGKKTAPSTQQDIWIWIHGKRAGEVFDIAMQTHAALQPIAKLFQETRGMIYRGGRDLTGFVDGTANPRGAEAKKVALIPTGLVGEGGSYALAMRWVHDLTAFHALPVADQEAVIGRTKKMDKELSGAKKKPDAHISRMEIEENGEELQIYRRSVPYGSLREQGLYFLAFSAEPSRFARMLQNMYGLGDDRIEDRLTDYSRAASASNYFMPSKEALRSLLR